MKKKLFGTDGIRGKANEFPLTLSDLAKIGHSMAHVINERKYYGHKLWRSVLIGKDTRLSGYMLEQTLASAFNSMGVHVTLVGPIPTPAVGFLAQSMRADAGIMISASHNPYYDNGIKIFGPDGYKIDSDQESVIEDLFWNHDFSEEFVVENKIGRSKRIEDVTGRYIVHAKNSFPLGKTLEGLKIVLDCAHGSTYRVAPKIFEELGAQVILIGADPNGFNINSGVGALHPQLAAKKVIEEKADLGICLDGDGDRVIFLDHEGEAVDGDIILGAAAIHLNRKKALKGEAIVVNQVSNLGLDMSLKKEGIGVERTPVGDRFVLERMRQKGIHLGGENSGHLIFSDYTTTGDGCVSALQILSFLLEEGKTLKEIRSLVHLLPQVRENISFVQNKGLKDLSNKYHQMKKNIEEALDKVGGRLLIRPSGTEKKIRMLLEGQMEDKKLYDMGQELAQIISKELN